jgi:hypothetical protein
MCRASISVLLMLLLGGMLAFAASFAPLPAPPPRMPCGGHHSCCISPSPGTVPALPSTLNRHRSPVARSCGAPFAVRPSSNYGTGYAVDTLSLPTQSAFSTVLRI